MLSTQNTVQRVINHKQFESEPETDINKTKLKQEDRSEETLILTNRWKEFVQL